MATALAGAGAKRLVRRSEEDDRALGDALVAEMDRMKGMAMKLGQILSYMDVPLPSATTEALGRLQKGAEPLARDEVARVVEAALGRPVQELFERFDPTPVAAASIGQVHRARHAGREVAVKVRYPGIEETFDADIGQLHRIAAVATLATAVDGRALVGELHARLREECDTLAEARAQEAFRTAFAHDPDVVIPAVVAERTADGVLTTEWIDGVDLQTLAATGSQHERDRAGLVLARFAWTSFFVHGAIQADPHPGNQLHLADGRVALLDFGCVRSFDPTFVEAWRRVFVAVLDGDRAAFDAAVPATGMVGDERFDLDEHHAMIGHLLEPYLSATFSFDQGYLARGATHFGPRRRNLRHMAIPPAWIWLARLQVGLHAVLARLRADGPFRDVLVQSVRRPLAPITLR
jgi:predicted unusual protein kinase regulating ubiquinone biosynthesis (AarF/ABC1/UbiB family)